MGVFRSFLTSGKFGRSRRREPEEGPGSELVTTMPMSSISQGVRWWKGLLVAWSVSIRGRLGEGRRGARAVESLTAFESVGSGSTESDFLFLWLKGCMGGVRYGGGSGGGSGGGRYKWGEVIGDTW